MRREAPPTDGARETELVEVGGIVFADATREHVAFPGVRRKFKPLQLREDFEQSALTTRFRTRRDMLPTQEPPHELRLGNGLNLPAQSGDGQAVNAGQQPSVAKFGRWLRNIG